MDKIQGVNHPTSNFWCSKLLIVSENLRVSFKRRSWNVARGMTIDSNWNTLYSSPYIIILKRQTNANASKDMDDQFHFVWCYSSLAWSKSPEQISSPALIAIYEHYTGNWIYSNEKNELNTIGCIIPQMLLRVLDQFAIHLQQYAQKLRLLSRSKFKLWRLIVVSFLRNRMQWRGSCGELKTSEYNFAEILVPIMAQVSR